MKLGFIGVGRMGSVMAPRLLAAGHDLVVWNRSPAKTAATVAHGARLAPSPGAVLAGADIVLLMTDTAGTHAALADPPPLHGRTVVVMGTLPPDDIVALCALVRAAGGRAVEAPVLGTVAPAAAGQVVALVGGDAADVETVRPVLAPLARRIVHTGAVGSAATMKLAHNLLLSNYWTILGEALALGAAGGLDRGVMLDILSGSAAANGGLALKLPVLLGEHTDVAFDVHGMARELAATMTLAASFDLSLPVTALTSDLALAEIARGGGGRDVAAITNRAASAARRAQPISQAL